MTAPAASSAPRSKSRRTLVIGGVIAVVLLAALVPPLLAGGLMVPVTKVTFGETTGSFTPTNVNATVQVVTAYEWLFAVRTGGTVRTTDTDVSSSRGTANITIRLELTNPSNQTIDLGETNINGSAGTRNHTIYLSADQGVRVPGDYKLAITITVNVIPIGGVLFSLSTILTVNFKVT